MFAIAFLLGVYANCLFLLGLLDLYTKPILLWFTLLFIFLAIVFWHKFDEKFDGSAIIREMRTLVRNYPLWCLALIIAFCVMLLGALSPETAFDALWYHLTLPKLFLLFGGIRYIPGGLFYYSTMPKVGEMFYTVALSLGNDTLAHIVHLSFGLLTSIAIYLLAKKYTTPYFALIAVAIFLSNIVVLWEATTAYIDLIRAFFEIMALWGILNYLEKKDKKWLIESAFLYGLALETKLVALASLSLFLILLVFFGVKKVKGIINDTLIFILLSLLVPLPWFVFSLIHTGNPIYPLLSNYKITLGKDLLAFPQTLTDLFTVFINASDPISPIYLMLFPIVIIVRNKLSRQELLLVIISGISLVIWTLTPKTGGGRFLLPYLPLLSLTAGLILYKLRQRPQLLRASLVAIFIVLVTSIGYRLTAQMRSLPVVFGLETRQTYLAKRLNFSFGDYYDTDGKLKQIVGSKTVLLYGFHNLYYMDIPFIDSSFVQKGDKFNYIATQNMLLPKRFAYWQPIYYNPLTGVTLYTVGQPWIY